MHEHNGSGSTSLLARLGGIDRRWIFLAMGLSIAVPIASVPLACMLAATVSTYWRCSGSASVRQMMRDIKPLQFSDIIIAWHGVSC